MPKKLTEESARKKLKQICEETTLARNSRREKNQRHDTFNKELNEMASRKKFK